MAAVNVNENWIHHEDARRGERRRTATRGSRHRRDHGGNIKRMGKFDPRRLKPCGLALELPDEMLILRAGHPTAVMRGAIGECVLYLAGRRDAAGRHPRGRPRRDRDAANRQARNLGAF